MSRGDYEPDRVNLSSWAQLLSSNALATNQAEPTTDRLNVMRNDIGEPSNRPRDSEETLGHSKPRTTHVFSDQWSRWALILRNKKLALTSPASYKGSHNPRLMATAANALEDTVNRLAQRFTNVGPQRFYDEVVKCIGALSCCKKDSLDRNRGKLRGLCIKLTSYAIPPAHASTQIYVFKAILRLVTTYFNLNIRHLLLECIGVECSGDDIYSALLSHWGFSQDSECQDQLQLLSEMAASCLCGTNDITHQVESTSLDKMPRVIQEERGVIHTLLVATNSGTQVDASIAVRYLAGICGLPVFWRHEYQQEHTRTAVMVLARAMVLVEDLPDSGDFPGEAPPCDIEGVDLLTASLLNGIKEWYHSVPGRSGVHSENGTQWQNGLQQLLTAVHRRSEILPSATSSAESLFIGSEEDTARFTPTSYQQDLANVTTATSQQQGDNHLRAEAFSPGPFVAPVPSSNAEAGREKSEDCSAVHVLETHIGTPPPSQDATNREHLINVVKTRNSAYGFKVLHEPNTAAVVDIVCIHGLNGDAVQSWISESESGSVCWPRDLLPLHVPMARILSYGYDGTTQGSRPLSHQSIPDMAEDLMVKFTLFRQDGSATNRPVIFIAHSVGGILLKYALVASNLANADHNLSHRCLHESTSGVVFMGTPHQGAKDAPWQTTLASIDSLFSGRNILGLERDSEALRCNSEQFTAISAKYKTIYIYETSKSLLSGDRWSVIVPKASAVVPGHRNSQVLARNTNHLDLAKFSKADDDGFPELVALLLSMVRTSRVSSLSCESEESTHLTSIDDDASKRPAMSAPFFHRRPARGWEQAATPMPVDESTIQEQRARGKRRAPSVYLPRLNTNAIITGLGASIWGKPGSTTRFRNLLNITLTTRKLGERPEWEYWPFGPRDHPVWTAVVKVNGRELGRGQSHTLAGAKEAASQKACILLQETSSLQEIGSS